MTVSKGIRKTKTHFTSACTLYYMSSQNGVGACLPTTMYNKFPIGEYFIGKIRWQNHFCRRKSDSSFEELPHPRHLLPYHKKLVLGVLAVKFLCIRRCVMPQ